MNAMYEMECNVPEQNSDKQAEKSVGGHVKKSITSSFFNRITFYSAVRCKSFRETKL